MKGAGIASEDTATAPYGLNHEGRRASGSADVRTCGWDGQEKNPTFQPTNQCLTFKPGQKAIMILRQLKNSWKVGRLEGWKVGRLDKIQSLIHMKGTGIASEDTATASYGLNHEGRRGEGSARFRLGGCADVCHGLSKKMK